MRSGFTIIELLLTVGLIALVSGVVLINVLNRKNSAELSLTVSRMTALLREAQSQAVSQASSSNWGVHFENSIASGGFYALFVGTYNTSSRKAVYALPTTLEYSNWVGINSSTEIIFNQLSGTPQSTTSIVIDALRATSAIATISVDNSGSISFATSTR